MINHDINGYIFIFFWRGGVVFVCVCVCVCVCMWGGVSSVDSNWFSSKFCYKLDGPKIEFYFLWIFVLNPVIKPAIKMTFQTILKNSFALWSSIVCLLFSTPFLLAYLDVEKVVTSNQRKMHKMKIIPILSVIEAFGKRTLIFNQ